MTALLYILFSSTAVLTITNTRVSKMLYYTIIFILILIASFRSPGLDYTVYYNEYYGNGTKLIEPAITLISQFYNGIGLNHFSLFVTFAFLSLILKAKGIEKVSPIPILSISVLLSKYFIYHDLIQIRAGVVAGIFIFSLQYLHSKKFKTYSSLMLLACTFHISAIVLLLLIFLERINLKPVAYFFLILISLLVPFSGYYPTDLISYIPIERIQILYEGYRWSTEKGIDQSDLNLFSSLNIFRYLFTSIFLIYFNKLNNINKYFHLQLKIYLLSSIVFNIFSDLPVVAIRISQLLETIEITLLPNIIYLFNEESKKLSAALFLGILLITMSLLIFRRGLL